MNYLVLVGSTDGKVHVWATDSGMKMGTLQGDHNGPVQCVQFNPKYMMLATACSNMVSVLEFSLHRLFCKAKPQLFKTIIYMIV